MPSQPPLVPSKAALRVLYHLAFAGSAATALGVVSINYHVYRQLMQAEHCRERKRQLKALSSGTGRSSLARLIEAAEAGYDIDMQAIRVESTFGAHSKASGFADPASCAPLPQRPKRAREVGPRVGWTALQRKPAILRKYNMSHDPCQRPRHSASTMSAVPPIRTRLEGGTEGGFAKRRKLEQERLHTRERDDARESAVQPTSARRFLKMKQRPTRTFERGVVARITFPPNYGCSHSKIKAIPEAVPSERRFYHSRSKAEYLPAPSSSMNRIAQAPSHHAYTTTPTGDEHPWSAVHGDIGLSSAGNSVGLHHSSPSTVFSTTIDWAQHPAQELITEYAQYPHCLGSGSPDNSVWKREVSSPPRNPRQRVKSQPLVARSPPKAALVLADSKPIDTALIDNQLYQDVKASQSMQPPRHHLGGSTLSTTTPYSKAPPAPPPSNDMPPVSQMRSLEFTPWPHLRSPSDPDQSEGPDDMVRLLNQERAGEPQLTDSQDDDMLIDPDNQDRCQEETKLTPFVALPQSPALNLYQERRDEAREAEPSRPASDSPEALHEAERMLRNLLARLEAKVIMTQDDRAKVAFQISHLLKSDVKRGVFAWRAAIRQRLACQDFATLDFLYRGFVDKGSLDISPRHKMVQSLIQWHYQSNTHCPRVAEILFPSLHLYPKASSSTSNVPVNEVGTLRRRYIQSSQAAIRFLQGLWEDKVDPGFLMLNFRRVIAAAKLRGAKLVEELFAVVIRYLSSVGEMATAQAVHDEMVYYHGIDATFMSKSVLLRGYARVGDWDRVEHEIELLHHQGLSRSRPHGFAGLINAVLKEYSARRSVEQVQSFVINAVSFWGLIPTSAVSATVVQAYMSSRRYDLIREWMETMQVLFPKIETESGLFQWVMSNTWHRTKASCQEIEGSLRALMYRNPGSKMKVYSIPTIYEALSRDLVSRLNAARDKVDPPSQSSNSCNGDALASLPVRPLEDNLSSVFSLLGSATFRDCLSSDVVIDLHRQALSVERLISFLNGGSLSSAVDKFVFPTIFSPPPIVGGNRAEIKLGISHLNGGIPESLLAPFLPETNVVIGAVLRFYHDRNQKGQRSDHLLLRWVCEKLHDADRSFDAIYVIQKVYSQPMVRQLSDPEAFLASVSDPEHRSPSHLRASLAGGVLNPFPMEFFEFWMRLAWVTKSIKQWRAVVEEVLRLSGAICTASPSQPAQQQQRQHDQAQEQPTTVEHAPTSSTFPPPSSSHTVTTTPPPPPPLPPSSQAKAAMPTGSHSATDLAISASFIFLSRHCAIKLLKANYGGRHLRQVDRRGLAGETFWLLDRLVARRQAQIGWVDRWDNRPGR